MEWDTDFAPALAPDEYRVWAVQSFHDAIWQHALAALTLSTKDYAAQVAQVYGRTQMGNILASVMAYIRTFERQIAGEIEVDASIQNLAMFRDAENRIRSAVRYCLDNGLFQNQIIAAPLAHPTEALQTYDRDPESLELISSRTVYKFN